MSSNGAVTRVKKAAFFCSRILREKEILAKNIVVNSDTIQRHESHIGLADPQADSRTEITFREILLHFAKWQYIKRQNRQCRLAIKIEHWFKI